jgi:hypothetical protein
MRRIFLVAALAAGLLVAAPAMASPQAANVEAAQVAAALRAAGFMAWHTDGVVEGSKGWFNEDNGRIYRFLFRVEVAHDPAQTRWYPEAVFWCTRTLGNLTVDNPCDYYGTFKAVVSPDGSSVNSVGSRPLSNVNFGGDVTCRTQIYDQGADRAYGSSYPWFMSYVENFQVTFLTSACAHIHDTHQYDIGSKLVNGQTEVEITHNLTGIAG